MIKKKFKERKKFTFSYNAVYAPVITDYFKRNQFIA